MYLHVPITGDKDVKYAYKGSFNWIKYNEESYKWITKITHTEFYAFNISILSGC